MQRLLLRIPRLAGAISLAVVIAVVVAPGCTLAGAASKPASSPRVGTQPAPAGAAGVESDALRDPRSGRVLYRPVVADLYEPPPGENPLVPTITIFPKSNGFDVRYRFTNGSTGPRPLGSLRVGPVRMGEQIEFRDFRWDGRLVAAHARTNPPRRAWTYPRHLYSPVTVAESDNLVVGVSLLYPVMEHRHDALQLLSSPKSAVGEERGWLFEWRLSNFGSERGASQLMHPAALGAGETREYTVVVRVSGDRGRWQETLLPYREYFRSKYGGVRYTRDPRPVKGVMLTSTSTITNANPYGFVDEKTRPDIHGWGPLAAEIADLQSDWSRVMVWTPTGLYRKHRSFNMPFRFTSHWLEGAEYGHRMGDAVQRLRALASPGFSLGLWWGRSSQVVREWDGSTMESINPSNPEHVRIAARELEIAVDAGATMIGLDAFFHTHTPLWRLYPWLAEMQRRAPGVRFVTEARCPDVLHTLAPTFTDAYTSLRTLDESYTVSTPPYLADFLLPGHEVWAGMLPGRLREHLGRRLSRAEVSEEAKRLAELGYVPVMIPNAPPVPGMVAAKTWLVTVPPDLRLPDRPDPAPPLQVAPTPGS